MAFFPEQIPPENVASIPVQPLPQATSRVRLFFLDHLRTALTILVVVHHLAAIYAVMSFYYTELPAPNDQLGPLLLSIFVLINQAYFMGFFFLISGYFTPSSFDRKGPLAYYKDRLLRLGIPLVVYVLVLDPLTATIAYHQMLTDFPYHLTVPTFIWQQFPFFFATGPLWFAEMLLLFGLGYVIWQRLRRTRVQPTERIFSPPSYWAIGLFILVLALASYLIRIVVPVLGGSGTIFGFPSLAYLPQYLSFFILGAVACRRNWFQTIPGSMGIFGFVAAVLVTIVSFFPIYYSNGAFVGYGTWQSAIYALWDSIFSVGMCLGLITFFRRFLNHQNRFGHFLSQHAFTVYIIHAPVIVLLAIAIRGIHLEALLKFALVALIGMPLCFVLAFLVRKIPFASRVL